MLRSRLPAPQEEADDTFSNPEPTLTSDSLDDGEGDTIWLCTSKVAANCDGINNVTLVKDYSEFKRFKWVHGVLVDENNRGLS